MSDTLPFRPLAAQLAEQADRADESLRELLGLVLVWRRTRQATEEDVEAMRRFNRVLSEMLDAVRPENWPA